MILFTTRACRICPATPVFATEYLPGQYDQRADSAAQCIQLLTSGEYPAVASARILALEGELSQEDVLRIRAFVINPVESRLASMDKPDTLASELPVPAPIASVEGFCAMSEEAVAAYHASMGFAMTAADLCFCRDYFRDEEHRDPTLTELKVIDTYWSDHCRHTTFLTKLEQITVEEGELVCRHPKRTGAIFCRPRRGLRRAGKASAPSWTWRP